MGDVDGIEEREWVVVRIGDDPVRIPRPPTIRFGDEGRFTGSTGVNRMFGSYAVVDGILSTSAAGTTRMAGPPESMAVEQRFLTALNAGGPIEVDDSMLRIGSGDDRLTLRLVAAADPEPPAEL